MKWIFYLHLSKNLLMKRWLLLGVFALALVQCKKENVSAPLEDNSQEPSQAFENQSLVQDSLAVVTDSIPEKAEVVEPVEKKSPKQTIAQGEKYSIWPHKGNDSLMKKFNKEFSAAQKYTIAALNRIDVDHIKTRDSLIVPNEFYTDFLQYSPFPNQVEILQPIDKFIVFSYPIQAYAVYEKGTLKKWGPTNMGKKTAQTPRRLYFTNWKGRKVKSTVDSEWILNWNFNIHNSDGIGFHQYALPGYPASHSCLRLLDADAQWLYNWADQWVLKDSKTVEIKGNPVLVYGDYNFGVKGIWYQLYKDPTITTVSESQLTQLVQPHMEEMLREQNKRKAYLDTKKGTTIEQDSEITTDTIQEP